MEEGLLTSFAHWLTAIGLESYASVFAQNEIYFDVLASLTEADLQALGLSLGARKRLVQAIAKLDRQGAAEAISAPTASSPALESSAGERRQLTVMFCDLVGSTALSEKLDPEELRALLHAYRTRCGEVISRYEGFVARYVGDGILTYFGWPKAHEEDAERALRAALEIVQAVKGASSAEPLSVHIGIATGPVVVGEQAGVGEQSKLAVGSTPNLAARLQGLAAADQIIIASSTRRLVGNSFELADLGEHELKGIADPVHAWRVMAVSAAVSRFEAMHPAGLTPFVGRDEEIGLLLARWKLAKGGEGQVVLLEGEPGIGKSRITNTLRSLIAQEPHTRVQYQCSPFYTNSAFHPIIAQLGRAAGFESGDGGDAKLDKLEALIGADDHTDWALIATLLSLPTDRYPALNLTPPKQKERTIEVLVGQLAKLATDNPILLVFEDVHWIDPTSLEMLDQLIGGIAAQPVLAVITFRPAFDPQWGAHSHVTLHSLNRLGKRQSALLVERVTDKALPGVLVEQIIAKTDGVPLFIEELTKAVIESDIVTDASNRYELSGAVDSLAIPDTLHDALMARLDKLIPVKEVAQVGAAIGREFSHQLIALLSPMSEIDLNNALDKLVASELVFRRGTPPQAIYIFKHALVQDAAYNSMLKRDRLDLHKKIAETLAANFPAIAETEPEILAHHYTRAEIADAAVPKWLAAGQLALSRFAPTEALGHLGSGLRLINRLAESRDRDRLELALHMATAAAYNATQGWASDHTKATYDRALPIIKRLGNDESTFDTMIGIYYFYNVRGQMDQGAPIIVDAVNYADRQGSAANKLVAYQAYGQNTLYRGEFSKAVDCLEMSMSVYDRAKHAALANVWGTDFYASDLAWLGSVYWLVGRPDQASLAVERAREHAQSMQQAHTEAWVESICSLARLLQGELDLAVETAISACEKASAIDFKVMECIARAVLGAAHILQGANSLGISELESGLASFQGLGGGCYVPWFNSILAFGYAKDGRFDDAQRLLDGAGRQAELGGEIWSDPLISEMRGKVSLLKGERPQAIDHFTTGLETAHNLASPSLALRLATNLAVLVDPDAGRSILGPIYHQFTEGFAAPDLRAAKQVVETLN